jgi:hypothetical protein
MGKIVKNLTMSTVLSRTFGRTMMKLFIVLWTLWIINAAVVPNNAVEKLSCPLVEVCELIKNPNRYDNQPIKVKGILVISGGEERSLYDPDCGDSRGVIWVEFHKDFKSNSPMRLAGFVENMIDESRPRPKKSNPGVVIVSYRHAEIVAYGLFKAASPPGYGKETDETATEVEIKFGVEHPATGYKYHITLTRLEHIKEVSPDVPGKSKIRPVH